MAGDWLKLEANTPEKEEVLAITARLGWDDADLTVGKLFRLWRWFDQHTTNGNAARVTTALLDRIIGVSGFCEAVQEVGWLEIGECGITLPKFARHNGQTAKSRAMTAKRVANHKSNAKGNGEGNASSVSDALPREEKRREEYSDTDVSGGRPPKLTDPNEIIFGYGVPMLVNAGTVEKQARSFLGGLRKTHGEDALISALRECVRESPLQPLEWLAKALPPRGARGGSGVNRQEALEARNQAAVDEWLAKESGVINA